MIRLLLLLCAGIFVTLQIAGEDRGQLRFGLQEAAEAERLAQSLPVAATPRAGADQVAPPAPDTADVVTQVAFTPQRPVVTPVAAPETPAQPAAVAPDAVKYVTGRSVNVRSGPSTADGVVGKLTRGEAVTVVWIEENGWARIRLEGDGLDGYMSMDFLADAP